jgi:Rad3-related DNA helicase
MARPEILKAFNDLGYIPLENQAETVEKIICAFESGKKNVFLHAPTGSGKSLIALVVQKVIGQKAVIVTATNALTDQYKRDYPGVPSIIGANNYPCKLRQRLGFSNANAETCYKKSRFFYTRFETPQPECELSSCEFANTRSLKNKQPVVVTNYAYYIIDQLYIKAITGEEGNWFKVGLGIFDEAHLINEQFSQHYSIFYSISRGEEYLADIRKLLDQEDSQMEQAYRKVFNIIDENIERGSIGPANHMKFIDMLERFYLKMIDIIDTKKIYASAETSYDALNSMKGKYHGLFCKIDDYKKYKYEVVVDVKKTEGSLSVVPVFVGKTSEHMMQGLNLFMSATLDFNFMVKTLDLDKAECCYIQVPYGFNKDDKTIDFSFACRKLNFNNMNDDQIVADMRHNIETIVANHVDENGVIITTSFQMAKQLADQLTVSHDVICHENNRPAVEVIRQFKKASKPTILISPSLFEGVDFPGLISQFQIMPKAPFLSLGSKRMFHISRKHRTIYTQLTIMRMNQALGRSTRGRGDKSITYMLDENCKKLFRSSLNDCRHQFTVVEELPLIPYEG